MTRTGGARPSTRSTTTRGTLRRAPGGTGTYKTPPSQGDASLVKVDTTGQTPNEALTTWNATADETRAALLRLQKAKNVPENELVVPEPLTRPEAAQKESGSRIRALI